MDENKPKRIVYKKNLTVNKQERFCLHCGADISHRSKGVQFCCSNCKALYKIMQELKENDKPKKPRLVTKPEFHNDAASVYYPKEQKTQVKGSD